MPALSQARATMYASEMGESYQFQVLDRAAEMGAIADGCTPAPVYIPPPPKDWKDATPPAPPEYPKTMIHPGYPNGAATGLLMKDFRGGKMSLNAMVLAHIKNLTATHR